MPLFYVGPNVAGDPQVIDIAGLTPTDNGVVIGNGTNFVVESGATLKTSLGYGTAAVVNTGVTGATVPLINTRPVFSADKSASNQTGIASITYTKVTFTAERNDVGSYYDSTNSIWTPPAGPVRISSGLYLSAGVTVSSLNAVALYKNSAIFKQAIGQSAVAGSCGLFGSWVDVANGTDTYEIYVYLTTGTTGTVSGTPTDSYFMGEQI